MEPDAGFGYGGFQDGIVIGIGQAERYLHLAGIVRAPFCCGPSLEVEAEGPLGVIPVGRCGAGRSRKDGTGEPRAVGEASSDLQAVGPGHDGVPDRYAHVFLFLSKGTHGGLRPARTGHASASGSRFAVEGVVVQEAHLYRLRMVDVLPGIPGVERGLLGAAHAGVAGHTHPYPVGHEIGRRALQKAGEAVVGLEPGFQRISAVGRKFTPVADAPLHAAQLRRNEFFHQLLAEDQPRGAFHRAYRQGLVGGMAGSVGL